MARLFFKVSRSPAVERRVLIVGGGSVGQRVGLMLQEYDWTGLRLAGYLDDEPERHNSQRPVLGTLGEVRRIVEEKRIDDVVIALPQRAYGQVNKLVLTLHDLPVQVRVVPDYFSLALYRAKAEDFGGLPMINLRDPALSEFQRLVKRMFDLAVSLLMFPLVLPLFVLIALAIKLDSPGPVFFRQERVGENGRLFRMFKFRTMVVGAETMQGRVNKVNGNGDVLHKHENDPRVTRIGRFLRRTSLDEMPQFINVLIGEMSLVGPRPEMPWLVDSYEPWQHKRFAVPQGMTGWWQVNGRSEKPMHLHTEDDLYYVQNYSLWMDLYILLKTPLVVLKGKGAY
ncbi:MAG: sugar transferase [Anaerolineae bacterium]